MASRTESLGSSKHGLLIRQCKGLHAHPQSHRRALGAEQGGWAVATTAALGEDAARERLRATGVANHTAEAGSKRCAALAVGQLASL